MQSLYLVDSSIYVFRGWYSLPDTLVNQDGQANNALIGFSDFVYHFLHNEKPQKLIFTFDESLKHSARKVIYPEYKANRSPAPALLKRQFQWCRDWISLLGFSQISSDQHEADDLIGSLANIHRNESCNIVIITADKDLAQLIKPKDIWWSFASGQQLNYRSLIKKFGVRPEQIADQLALAGDKIDNIPGIPGVGMAIAARLLTKFETLSNLRENLEKVKLMKFRGSERIMKLLIEHQAILDISSRLTPINCQVDAMKTVKINKAGVDKSALIKMMEYQNMGESRKQKWLQLIESNAL